MSASPYDVVQEANSKRARDRSDQLALATRGSGQFSPIARVLEESSSQYDWMRRDGPERVAAAIDEVVVIAMWLRECIP